MKIKFSILLLLLLAKTFAANTNYKLSVIVNAAQNKEAKLFLYNGLEKVKIGENKPNDKQTYLFTLSDTSAVGFYLFQIDSLHQFDFVFNKENIEIRTNYNYFFDSLQVVNSIENKFYQQYFNSLQLTFRHLSMLNTIATERGTTDKNSELIGQVYESISNEFDQNLLKKADTIKCWFSNYIKTITRTGTAKVLLSKKSITPSEIKLLKDIYLENINFSDESLIHTRILPDQYYFYLNNLTANDNSELIKSIEVILTKASANEKVFNFTKRWMVELFKNSGKEDITAYVKLAKIKK